MGAKLEAETECGLMGVGCTLQNVVDYHKKIGHPSIDAT
jgi:hypothetical protein